MEIIAATSAVAVAVVGWIVGQVLARRALRRTMRVEYLLVAYRRLERVSNRPMTLADEREIEAAVADVQLLGSPEQVELVQVFVTAFAAEGRASTDPLLDNLRDSLRRELLLEDVPPVASRLRISRQGGTVTERASVWHGADLVPQQAIATELASLPAPSTLGNEFLNEMMVLAETVSPSAAIESSIQRVEHRLRSMVVAASNEQVSLLNVSQLASRALELRIIDAALFDTINGLGVMRLMAAMNQDRLDLSEAKEFATLCAAALYVLNTPRRKRP
jgi:hypothetical protein